MLPQSSATVRPVALNSCGDRGAEWQALIDLGFLWASRDYARTGDYFRSALALARALGDSATIAQSLNRIGNWHVNLLQPLDALRYHREALAIVETLHDQSGLAETLDLLGMASFQTGDWPSALGYSERAIALFRELDLRSGLASSLTVMTLLGGAYAHDTIVPGGWSVAACEAAGDEALRIARDTAYRAG